MVGRVGAAGPAEASPSTYVKKPLPSLTNVRYIPLMTSHPTPLADRFAGLRAALQ